MGTRSVIARRTGAHAFEGVYHHWDGYPEGLGATLFQIYNGHFERDLPKMLRVLIDEHRGGWSTINGANWSLEPGYTEGIQKEDDADTERWNRPHCYCHGDRHEKPGPLFNERNASSSGCEYAYVFTDGARMLVLSSHVPDGRKMVGAFGGGADKVQWVFIGDVDLNGEEPDWEKMKAMDDAEGRVLCF